MDGMLLANLTLLVACVLQVGSQELEAVEQVRSIEELARALSPVGDEGTWNTERREFEYEPTVGELRRVPILVLDPDVRKHTDDVAFSVVDSGALGRPRPVCLRQGASC